MYISIKKFDGLAHLIIFNILKYLKKLRKNVEYLPIFVNIYLRINICRYNFAALYFSNSEFCFKFTSCFNPSCVRMSY